LGQEILVRMMDSWYGGVTGVIVSETAGWQSAGGSVSQSRGRFGKNCGLISWL